MSKRPPLNDIARQHEQLRATLAQVGACTSLSSLLPLLQGLRAQLEAHFADEEGEDGLGAVIGETAPRHTRHIEMLFQEHRSFLGTLDDLLYRCRALLGDAEGRIFEDVKKLSEQLHDHEARETELLQDAVFTDMGVGD